jgi:tetratricopeptide (TPR) repeat protein
MGEAITMAIAALILGLIFSLFSKSKSTRKREALQKPRDVDANILYGNELVEKKQYDEALKFFNNIDRSISTMHNLNADFQKGVIYYHKSNFKESKYNFELVLKSPEAYKKDYHELVALSYFFIGGYYYLDNDFSNAKAYKQKAIEHNDELAVFKVDQFGGYFDL